MLDLFRTAVRVATVGALSLAPTSSPALTPGNEDTGIRASECYVSNTDVLSDCAATDLAGQDGQLGRDADPSTNGEGDGRLGFRFRKVCASGEAAGTGTCPSDPTVGDGRDEWACTVDDLTGIWWEVKATSGLRARDLVYTNYSRDYDPKHEYGTDTDAAGFVKNVNRAGLCGFDDWNLAHTDKVQSIVDYGERGSGTARVDGGYFPTMQAAPYWNASPNPSKRSTAFALDFATGAASNADPRGRRHYAQVLRNGKTRVGPEGRYLPWADGTQVLDTTVSASLTWRRCVEGMSWDAANATCSGTPATFTHEQALRRAADVARSTGEAWRVPSVKEQNWLVQREIASPPIDHKAFPATPAAPSWTSTPETRTPDSAWAVDFGVGRVEPHSRQDLLVLRLVRDPVIAPAR